MSSCIVNTPSLEVCCNVKFCRPMHRNFALLCPTSVCVTALMLPYRQHLISSYEYHILQNASSLRLMSVRICHNILPVYSKLVDRQVGSNSTASAPSLSTFRGRPKTFLFQQSYLNLIWLYIRHHNGSWSEFSYVGHCKNYWTELNVVGLTF